jgi:hypothetical protein
VSFRSDLPTGIDATLFATKSQAPRGTVALDNGARRLWRAHS